MMIALVTGILAVVLICTLTIIVLLCRARWRHKHSYSSPSSSSLEDSSTSPPSSSSVSVPRIIFPRVAALQNLSRRRPALLGTHVWKQNNTGRPVILSELIFSRVLCTSRLLSSFVCNVHRLAISGVLGEGEAGRQWGTSLSPEC